MIFTTPFVNALSNFFLIPVTEEFGISRSAFTLTSTLVGICGMVFSPVWGKIFSKGNIRIVFSLGLMLFAVTYMSYSLAQNIYHMYLSALGVGIAFSGCAFMPVSILITAWFKKCRGLAMSLALSGIGVGGGVLSPVITEWIAVYGWRQTYFYMGFMVVFIALPIAFFLLRQTPESKGVLPFGEKADRRIKKGCHPIP
jgi:MFS family permease